MVICFLESVLTCTPILFVKFGQKAVGAIDFTMYSTKTNTGYVRGNRNFYNIDQFDNPLYPALAKADDTSTKIARSQMTELPVDLGEEEPCNTCRDKECFNITLCQNKYVIVYEDHVLVNTSDDTQFSFARTPYFTKKLEGLDGFYGFFPRTYLP